MPLYSFFNTRIPLQELLQVMSNLLYVLRGIKSTDRDQTSVNELLRTILGVFVVICMRGQQTAASGLRFHLTVVTTRQRLDVCAIDWTQ